MGEVLCSPENKEGWLGTAVVMGPEWEEATGGHQRGNFAGEKHRRGRDG